MHIAEGIISGGSAIGYSGAGLALVWYGTRKMKRFAADHPDKKPLLGMAGAVIFFVSLLPIPAFTGTCSHPCGTPFIAILFGPAIAIALTGGSLLLQAAFFAHGGFGTWGANVVALGLFGCIGGWGSFRIIRKMGLPLWFAGFAGGLIGDVMVYAVSGLILSGELTAAPAPQYSLSGYLMAIYAAYLPTQLPIAFGEMIITGLALRYIYKQRSEVLIDLGVVNPLPERSGQIKKRMLLSIFLALSLWIQPADNAVATHDQKKTMPLQNPSVNVNQQPQNPFSGIDESVNETLAEKAGIIPKDPYIDIEAMGDLWNALLLTAGGICGFILGRWWHLIGGKRIMRND
ncbi:energy-coupling factor ABC transporter permease [Desulfospira joergensenii]|uniref:energy-coupling factor ABC transporter permease n=1 Tax=Desulfospira joergensenii TaxID=53329 RepID=UPI0003B3DF07|nr:energy-coupling factor ABC transporter permease [Desulfospira joergensenii]